MREFIAVRASQSDDDVLSVADISLRLKQEVEGSFSHVRVQGEVSMPKLHTSGHLYFALKDKTSVLDAVCWRPLASRLKDLLGHGAEVVCEGKITTYPGRSKYQIVLTGATSVGEGDLFRILEERKQRLRAEGLFEWSRKKSLPKFPRCVGIITSPTGAVIRDIVHRLRERFPVDVLLYPVSVQGDGALQQVCEAIRALGAEVFGGRRPDVIILARGGGSFEDLFVFNEEALVRAVAVCPIPVVSAIGHETDTTLCDFASDQRAPTPTAAAELITPHRHHLVSTLDSCKRGVIGAWQKIQRPFQLRLDFCHRQLESGTAFLSFQSQRLDELEGRLVRCARDILSAGQSLTWIAARLRSPKSLWMQKHQELVVLQKRQVRAMQALWMQKLSGRSLFKRLHMASYKKTLDRGFCLTLSSDKKPIISAHQPAEQDGLDLVFHDGILPVQRRQS